MTCLATPFSHFAVPLALTMTLGTDMVPAGLMVLALACAVLPDIDAVGLWLGIPYEHPFGHRGFTHSLPFAAGLAGVGSLLAPALGSDPLTAFGVLLVSAASHGLLDALTNGGLGIAFFSPFSNRRTFLPWRVIEVSPLRPSELFSRRGLRVLRSELRWVWLPCGALALAGIALRELLGR
ncbi:MAG TPA: metal-dependent hydrolase [Thiobacillus sp.]|nr:metal-dependent hydrolase [Thiobacillus sp.]